MLVEEGKLAFDSTIRDVVPTPRFENKTLDDQATLRDVLSHRTGTAAPDFLTVTSHR